MDWLDKMNGALNYIEDNLSGEIHLEEVARRAPVPALISSGCFLLWQMFPSRTTSEDGGSPRPLWSF